MTIYYLAFNYIFGRAIKLISKNLVNDTSQLGQSKDIVEAIWGRYFPEGLKAGTLKAVPEPVVVGKGLEKIADGVDMLRKGVSAAKIVVEL